jgi:hypothetical protein
VRESSHSLLFACVVLVTKAECSLVTTRIGVLDNYCDNIASYFDTSITFIGTRCATAPASEICSPSLRFGLQRKQRNTHKPCSCIAPKVRPTHHKRPTPDHVCFFLTFLCRHQP